MSLLRTFQEGGFTMYWILLFGLGGLALSLVHAVVTQKWSLAAAASLLAIVLGFGVFGTLRGRGLTDNAVMNVGDDVELAEQMRSQGYAEAMRPMQFSGTVILLAGTLAIVGETRRHRGRAAKRVR